MSNITLELKARHFKGTDFRDNCNCAISKAIKEVLKCEDVIEYVNGAFVDGKRYSHEGYGVENFDIDSDKAASLNYSDAVIRTITLVKQ